MKKYVIIVAGGSGARMKAGIPKQFILLAGKPVLMHTIERFFEADPSTEIILALPESEFSSWKKLCAGHSFTIAHHVSKGGETRFQSVKNALASVEEKSVVSIHDGVRPFVSRDLIMRSFSEALLHGNAVPAIPLNESIRKVKGDLNEAADRDSFFIIQTPQCFKSGILKNAYTAGYSKTFTDDAAVLEFAGHPIHLIEGEKENIKITYPFDLVIGEAILKRIS